MDKTLIFIGGKGPEDISFLNLHGYSRIIAADSGYDRAKALGVEPDMVLGDMDSTALRSELIAKGFIPCPHDKDDSDFVLALKEVKGAYDLIGGGEGRLDHMISILSAFHEYMPPRLWLTREDVIFSSSCFKARMEKGTGLSFFPADISSAAVVSTSGLVWDLKERMVSLAFMSLSNRTREDTISISSSAPLLIRFGMDFFQRGAKIELC